jgi:bidirectional [NiFe] hydrogenase diaphorase subunit
MELTLNGKTCKAHEGQTVLEVGRANGIVIPTLCYHEGLGGYGACRLCLVEVVKGGPPGLHSSCTLPASDRLEVLTDSESVLRARRVTVEFLLARAPEAPAIRQLAAQHGVEKTELRPRNELCILCGRCVRACAFLGIHAINFSYRSTERRVGTPFDKTSEVCIACQACFHICPTGAIEASVLSDRVQMSSWKVDLEKAPCSRCGKPYVPVGAWQHLQHSQPEYLKSAQPLCPVCRRQEQLLRLHGTDTTG